MFPFDYVIMFWRRHAIMTYSIYVRDKRALFYHKVEFKLFVLCKFWKMVENEHADLLFRKYIQHMS